MIEKTSAYKTSDNQPFYDLASAQQHELMLLLSNGDNASPEVQNLASLLVQHAPQVIDILTSGGKARPRARKINGGAKPRKAKTPSPEVN